MSKVSIGDEDYEATDLLAYQQLNLWFYELALDAVDRAGVKVVDDLEGRRAKWCANIDWFSGS